MTSRKPPTFLGSVKYIMIGTIWTIGYLFVAVRMLANGYVVTAYAAMPFASLGIVVAIVGVLRFRRFLQSLGEEEKERVADAEPEPV